MAYSTLISTRELAERLNDPEWAIIDCRFSLNQTERGGEDYKRGHIPGAVYAHLDRDLSGRVISGKTGRHPLPSIESIAATFSGWGISDGVQVVAYDDAGGSVAARLWWMLRWLGHDAVAVLDGGWPQWQREGSPVKAGVEQRSPRIFAPKPRPEWLASTDEVVHLSRMALLLDARTPERYRGDHEPIDPVAGHIPGARCASFTENLTPEGRFRSQEELSARFQTLLSGSPPDQAICYCGSGVTGAHNVLAMEHAGLTGARLYAGSWSEWITDPSRPVEMGE
jgi:thiosulfate/3-mercaptopyruvate sulfurtransferase